MGSAQNETEKMNPPVQSALHQIEDAAKELAQCVDTLETRLGSVLTPSVPAPLAAGTTLPRAVNSPRSDVAERMLVGSVDVQVVISRLRGLMQRLEV